MPRRLRFLPSSDGRYAVEVMTRCFQGRFFLAKTCEPETKLLFDGVWAHALLDFPEIELCELICQVNHYRAMLVLKRPSEELLADFMGVVNSSIAREMNRAIDRTGRFWEDRYSAFPVGESQQEERLKYHLKNGIVTGDYRTPKHNPMPNTVLALTEGSKIAGVWIRRADHARARFKAGRWVPIEPFTDHLEITLGRLPVHCDLDEAAYRARMTVLVQEATEEGTAVRKKKGRRLKPVSRLLKLANTPLKKPVKSKHSPMPFAMGSAEQTKAWWAAYRLMLEHRQTTLKGLARALTTSMCWPEHGYRPCALRAAANGLSEGVAAAA